MRGGLRQAHGPRFRAGLVARVVPKRMLFRIFRMIPFNGPKRPDVAVAPD